MAASDRSETLRRRVRRSVVKVLAVSDPPDYEQPWQTLGATDAIGSGAIVDTRDGPHVLTNAHVVENHVYVEVRRYGQARKFEAEVAGIGHECDLAVLHVDDPAFFSGTRPLPFHGLPSLGDHVKALGFPIGGDRLSVTEGVVSRIEMTTYAQSLRDLLAVQIDAAINEGNSGGPVLKNGRMVGVAFQGLEDAENIGYVIPTPVVERFLADLEDAVFDGFPDLGADTQILESDAHRAALGMPHDVTGVLVTRLHYGGSAWNVLEDGDVILAVDGAAVANDGSVRFEGGARIEFTHRVSMRQVGETLPLTIWRDRRRHRVDLTLAPHRPLVPETPDVRNPRYFLYAGLLFVPLTHGLLQSWGSDWRCSAPPDLVALYDGGVRTPGRHEIVLLQKVLTDPVNRGYAELAHVPIEKVQGRRIHDLNELAARVDRTEETYVTFETTTGERIVIDRSHAEERLATILRRYGVREDRSGVRGAPRKGK